MNPITCTHKQQLVRVDKQIATQTCVFCKEIVAKWNIATGKILYDFKKDSLPRALDQTPEK